MICTIPCLFLRRGVGDSRVVNTLLPTTALGEPSPPPPPLLSNSPSFRHTHTHTFHLLKQVQRCEMREPSPPHRRCASADRANFYLLTLAFVPFIKVKGPLINKPRGSCPFWGKFKNQSTGDAMETFLCKRAPRRESAALPRSSGILGGITCARGTRT